MLSPSSLIQAVLDHEAEERAWSNLSPMPIVMVAVVVLSFTPVQAYRLCDDPLALRFYKGTETRAFADREGKPVSVTVTTTADRVIMQRPPAPTALNDDGPESVGDPVSTSIFGTAPSAIPVTMFDQPSVSVPVIGPTAPVSPVPLPGSGWLFGFAAAVTALALRCRDRLSARLTG